MKRRVCANVEIGIAHRSSWIAEALLSCVKQTVSASYYFRSLRRQMSKEICDIREVEAERSPRLQHVPPLRLSIVRDTVKLRSPGFEKEQHRVDRTETLDSR